MRDQDPCQRSDLNQRTIQISALVYARICLFFSIEIKIDRLQALTLIDCLVIPSKFDLYLLVGVCLVIGSTFSYNRLID
jgi:hypothetical protein